MRLASTGLAAVLGLSLMLPTLAKAEDYVLVIKNHRFQPAELTVPADKRIKLTIDNQDATAEEFESHDLRREKIIPGNSKASVWVGPLPAGEYGFFGEFHEDTAQGKLIAK
jgi:hypothetical protein